MKKGEGKMLEAMDDRDEEGLGHRRGSRSPLGKRYGRWLRAAGKESRRGESLYKT